MIVPLDLVFNPKALVTSTRVSQVKLTNTIPLDIIDVHVIWNSAGVPAPLAHDEGGLNHTNAMTAINKTLWHHWVLSLGSS